MILDIALTIIAIFTVSTPVAVVVAWALKETN